MYLQLQLQFWVDELSIYRNCFVMMPCSVLFSFGKKKHD